MDLLAANFVGMTSGTVAVMSDTPPWPADSPLSLLDSAAWRQVLLTLRDDLYACVHLHQASKRGAALAHALCSGPHVPAGWRITADAKVPKRARETLWRVARRSERAAESLVAGVCVVCGKKWNGAVDEDACMFAHPACIRRLVVSVKAVSEPWRDRRGQLASVRRSLEDKPLAVEWIDALHTFDFMDTADKPFKAVFVKRHVAIPEAQTLEYVLASRAEGTSPADIRRTLDRYKEANAAFEASMEAQAAKRARADLRARCGLLDRAGDFVRNVAAYERVWPGDLPRLASPREHAIFEDYLTLAKSDDVKTTHVKLRARLALAAAVLEDAAFVGRLPLALRAGAAFDRRRLGRCWRAAFAATKVKKTKDVTSEVVGAAKAAFMREASR